MEQEATKNISRPTGSNAADNGGIYSSVYAPYS